MTSSKLDGLVRVIIIITSVIIVMFAYLLFTTFNKIAKKSYDMFPKK